MPIYDCGSTDCLPCTKQFRQMLNGWLAIDENTPMSGQRIQLFHSGYGAGSGHFDPQSERWVLHFCINKEAVPEAWQPLPGPMTPTNQIPSIF